MRVAKAGVTNSGELEITWGALICIQGGLDRLWERKGERETESERAREHALLNLPAKLTAKLRTTYHGSVVCEPLGDRNAKFICSREVRWWKSGPLLN